MSDITYANTKLLKWLFSNQKQIDDFKNNGTILSSDKWSNLLSYPNHFSVYIDQECSLNILANLVREYFLNYGYYKKEYIRVIHPALIIICYEKLIDIIQIKENKIKKETMIFAINKLEKVRFQTNICFQLFWKLILDENIESFFNYYKRNKNNMMVDALNSLIFNSTIEEEISMDGSPYDYCNRRYIDYCLSLDHNDKDKLPGKIQKKIKLLEDKEKYMNKILIEFNEEHHEKDIDEIRKLNVFTKTNVILNQFFKVDKKMIRDEPEINISQFYKNILKHVSKTIYKNIDETAGIIFYLVCLEDFDIDTSIFFLDIYKNGNCFPLNTIINWFESNGFNKAKKFFKKNYDEYKDDIIKEEDDEIYLNECGIDNVILLPRQSDWDDIKRIKALYTNFRVKYFDSIFNFMESNDDYIILELMDRCERLGTFMSLTQPILEFINNKINDEPEFKTELENKFKIKLDDELPIFFACNNSRYTWETKTLKQLIGVKMAKQILSQDLTDSTHLTNRRLLTCDMVEHLIQML